MPRVSKGVRPTNPEINVQTGVELVIKDGFPIRKAAERVKVPYQTLARYVQKEKNKKDENVSFKPNYGNKKVMTTELEVELREYLVEASRHNYGLTLLECR